MKDFAILAWLVCLTLVVAFLVITTMGDLRRWRFAGERLHALEIGQPMTPADIGKWLDGR